MCRNRYIIYKEKLPTGCKSMSTSNYTIQIDDALCDEWWQEKRRATGTYGTKKKMKELNPNTSENYLLNSTSVCVWPLISFYGNSQLAVQLYIHSCIFIHGMHRDSFNFIILGLQKFEMYSSTKIWYIYFYFNIKLFESETSKYFNTLYIYTMFTLKLIYHHLIKKINVQDDNIMSL